MVGVETFVLWRHTPSLSINNCTAGCLSGPLFGLRILDISYKDFKHYRRHIWLARPRRFVTFYISALEILLRIYWLDSCHRSLLISYVWCIMVGFMTRLVLFVLVWPVCDNTSMIYGSWHLLQSRRIVNDIISLRTVDQTRLQLHQLDWS